MGCCSSQFLYTYKLYTDSRHCDYSQYTNGKYLLPPLPEIDETCKSNMNIFRIPIVNTRSGTILVLLKKFTRLSEVEEIIFICLEYVRFYKNPCKNDINISDESHQSHQSDYCVCDLICVNCNSNLICRESGENPNRLKGCLTCFYDGRYPLCHQCTKYHNLNCLDQRIMLDQKYVDFYLQISHNK